MMWDGGMGEWLARFSTFELAQPAWLWLLALLPLVAVLHSRSGPSGSVRYSSLALLAKIARANRSSPGKFLFFFRMLAIALMVVAMARPRVEQGFQNDSSEGIDIMLVLDFSYSMQEGTLAVGGKDYTYIDALKKITGDFIAKRPNDRMGVIGFAVQPYLVSPLTSDHRWVMEMLEDMRLDLGTAIGSAMVSAVQSLRQSDRATRVMVVVTDGQNNMGFSPLDAARLARKEGIRIYPVEITATKILAPRRIAAHPLYNVAAISGGQFFQASDFDSLSALYEHVELLEKSFVAEKKQKAHEELFPWLLVPALLLAAAEFALGRTRWMRLP